MSHTLYIHNSPDTIPCWYCGEYCIKTQPYKTIHEFFCDKHKPLEVMFRIAQHDVEPPNWFFNVIRFTLDNLRLDHNFYAGNYADVQIFISAKDKCWGSNFKTIDKVSADFLITSPIDKIHSYLKLYKVWS